MREIFFKTDIGSKRINQDACAYKKLSDGVCLVIADGMGSYEASEYAAEGICRFISENIDSYIVGRSSDSDKLFKELIDQGIDYTKKVIFKKTKLKIPVYSTLVVSIITTNNIEIFHVGDSRCYIYSKNEDNLWQTKDHSLGQKLVDDGLMTYEELTDKQLNALNNHLASDDYFIEYNVKKISEKKTVLLCTDGFSNAFEIGELKELISTLSNDNVDEKLDGMVALARERGGINCDNVTVIMCVGD